MLQTLQKLQDLFDGRERRNGLFVLAMMLILGLLEGAGVASIMPLVAVVMQPGLVHSNHYLATAYDRLAFTDTNSFLFFLAFVVLVLVIGRITFAAATQYAILRYSNALSYSLTTRLLEKYLRQPYVWFLNHHSSDLGKSVLSEVDEVINGSIMPGLQLTTRFVVTISILAVIIAVSPKISLPIMLFLGGGYAAVYYFVRDLLGRSGRRRLVLNRERYQIASDVLSGIKEVKVNGLESAYLQRFRARAQSLARHKTTGRIIGQVPQYVFEGLAHGGILVAVMLLLWLSQDNLSKVLPIIGLYAFAGLRVLPALQSIYTNLTNITFHRPALDALHADLAMASTPESSLQRQDVAPWPLRERIELNEVTYTYPQSSRSALVDVTLCIPARTTVGFIGETGAGKTTLVDVIIGLLEPQQGQILVDGKPIGRDNLRAWQRAIGYVPQHNFLVNDTVAANIAFGVAHHKIDMPAVERASHYAELHEFVINELPEGYNTVVGERGMRLSGGQRQRIAIARALYHDPDVLVFDEATSSLDNLTEKAIMDALHNLAHVKTILLIAHRLSTVRACDRIFFLAHGRLKSAGTFDELLGQDGSFEKLATAAE
jgi:ABC-type bacteriocin/lantibiotic exporter with double-glycine peptidase domain